MAYNCLNYGCDTLGTYQINNCEVFLTGGISAMLVLACNHQITDPSNATQVNAAIANGTAKLVNQASFSLEAPSPVTTPSLIACQPDIVTNYNRTALYENPNVSAINGDFHDDLFSGRSFGGVIFYECSANAAGVFSVLWVNSTVKFTGGLVVPKTNTELQRYAGTASWLGLYGPAMYTAPAGVFA